MTPTLRIQLNTPCGSRMPIHSPTRTATYRPTSTPTANGERSTDLVTATRMRPRSAQLIDDAEVELDPAARAALYSELQTVLYDDPMWLLAGQEGVVAAYRDDLKGWISNPLWPRPSLKFQFMDK